MKMTDLIGKNIKISAGTITLLSESGKTAGMVRSLDTFYNIRNNRLERQTEMLLWKAAREISGDEIGMETGQKFLRRLFRDCGTWYYIIDEAEIATINEWLAEYPVGFVNPRTVAFLEKQEQAAIDFGATIIRVASAKDTRKF